MTATDGQRAAPADHGERRAGSTTASVRPTSPASALNKVFPDHWSFMLGEVALYCFVILVVTGVYLTFFFQPSPTAGRLPRQLRAAAGRRDVGGLRVGPPTSASTSARAGHAPDPPLGGAAVHRRDHGAPGPRLLHRRVPPSARDQLDDRGHPAAARDLQRFRRLLAARRPAVGHRPAHRLLDRPVDPARRDVAHVAALRRRVPGARHHPAAVRDPHPAAPGR